MEAEQIKITGFTNKLHPYQIASYIIFFGDIITYIIIITSLSNDRCKIIGTILICLSSIFTIYFGYKTTNIDATDDYVIQTKQLKLIGKIFDPVERDYYCSTCFSFVQEKSKHCRRCNRCVEDFDHHCKWVNNCIGKKNYKVFIGLINSVLIFSGIYITFVLILTIEFINEPTLQSNNIYLFNNDYNNLIIGMIILWIFTFITLILFVMDLHLVLLHFWLMKHNITTFAYIALQRKKKEEQYTIQEQMKALKEKEKDERELKKKDEKEKNKSKVKNPELLKSKNNIEIKKTCLDFILCLGDNNKIKLSQSMDKKTVPITDIRTPISGSNTTNSPETKNLVSAYSDNPFYSAVKKDSISLDVQEGNHNGGSSECQLITPKQNLQGIFDEMKNTIENKEPIVIEFKSPKESDIKPVNPKNNKINLEKSTPIIIKNDRSKNEEANTNRTNNCSPNELDEEDQKELMVLENHANKNTILKDPLIILDENKITNIKNKDQDTSPRLIKYHLNKNKIKLTPISENSYDSKDESRIDHRNSKNDIFTLNSDHQKNFISQNNLNSSRQTFYLF